jgi:hypothetical protein
MIQIPPLLGLGGPPCLPIFVVVPPTLTNVGATIPGNVLSISDNGTWTGSPTLYAYSWRRNGIPIFGEVASTYTLQVIDVGTVISGHVQASSPCAVSVTESTTPASFPVCPDVVNSVPPTLLLGIPPYVPGQILQITDNGTWTGSPTSFAYSWKRDGVLILGEVANTYTLLAGDAGKTITAFVTASNACTSTTQATNPTGCVVCATVVNTVAPVISGLLPEGSLLTTTNGTWLGTPTTFTYQWNRNGGALGGATASTYTTVAGDVGQSITCTVTATSACGAFASQVSNALVPTSAALPPCANCTGIQTNGIIITGPAPGGGLCSPDARHSYCFEAYDGTPACRWYYRFDANFHATIDFGIERPGEYTIRVNTPTYTYTTNAPGYYNPPIQCIGGQLTMAGTVQLASTGGCAPVTFALGAVAPCVAPCTFCNGVQPSMTVSGWIGGCAANNGVYTFTSFISGTPCTWLWDKVGTPGVSLSFNAGVWTISQPGATVATVVAGVSCVSNTIVGTAVADNLPGICNPPTTPITFSFP